MEVVLGPLDDVGRIDKVSLERAKTRHPVTSQIRFLRFKCRLRAAFIGDIQRILGRKRVGFASLGIYNRKYRNFQRELI